VPELLRKIGSRLNPSLIARNHIGCELDQDFKANGAISPARLLEWNYYSDSLIKIINGLLNDIGLVVIAEYWENSFKLKLEKNDALTIGSLFGFFDENVYYK